MLALYLQPFIKGLSIGAGLIIAIGPQNALVLTQGIKKEYPVLIASICFLVDVTLIILGVSGVGLLLKQSPVFLAIARWGGATFLFVYGLRAFIRSFNQHSLNTVKTNFSSWRIAAITTLTISILNPHVYLDTVFLLGSIGGQLPSSEQPWFTAGAITASFFWFYGLAIGATKLAPLFRQPRAWQILDCLIGLIMWAIAITLILAL